MPSKNDSGRRWKDRAFVGLQRILPTRLLSTLVFYLTQSRQILWKRLLISTFMRAYDINLGEAVKRKPLDYASFNEFFTRALRPGARPQPEDPTLLSSPVDGRLSQFGAIDGDQLIQAKGRTYSLTELLADNFEYVRNFRGGQFATIYLAPFNYHRIHMPCDGKLTSWSYVPGRLFSVNPATARELPNLFGRNERLIAHFETPAGPLAVIMVGALFVGGLETVWAGQVTPPHQRKPQPTHYELLHPKPFRRGDEIGRFNMGSTVILLAGKNVLSWLSEVAVDEPVSLGAALAQLKPAQLKPAQLNLEQA